MTEQQRMDEGRRMFQIFAARMFEQRVLSAYKEKVARERQEALIGELESEKLDSAEKQAKKARDAAKKKNKKAQQKQAKAEEKAKRDAEKAAEEAAARAIEEKKLEEQRKRKEEQKKKKDAERKALEEEKKRKELEKLRLQRENLEKQEAAERKAREQKAQEKKVREEAKRKERDTHDAKERKQPEEKRDIKAKGEKDAKDKTRKDEAAGQPGPPPGIKRPTQPAAVPSLPRQISGGIQSPQIAVATPAIPKAPTPGRPRQSSMQGSHGSSPKTPSAAASTSKSVSPGSATAQPHTSTAPKQILQKPQGQPPGFPAQLPHSGMGPGSLPAGTPGANAFGGYPPGLNGLPHSQGPLPGMMHRGSTGQNMGFFPPQGPPMGGPMRSFSGSMPPGMHPPGMMPPGHGHVPPPIGAPPGFGDVPPGMSTPQFAPGFGTMSGTHSRNASGSYDKTGFDSQPPMGPPAQPIQRPNPIGRPPSTSKHHDAAPENRKPMSTDIENLANALGSSALLDDDDDPYLPNSNQARRASAAPSLARSGSMGFPGYPNTSAAGAMNPGFSSMGLSTGAPAAFAPGFGGLPGMPGHTSTWRSSPTSASGWPQSSGFPPFGSPTGGTQPHPGTMSRPVLVRLAVCAACRALSTAKPSGDGFHPMADILARANGGSIPPNEPPVQWTEVLDIIETEGDSMNGGGSFSIRQEQGSPQAMIKFEPEKRGANRRTVGEIGSPLLSDSTPAFGGSPHSAPNVGAGAIGGPAPGAGPGVIGGNAAPGAGRFPPIGTAGSGF
jgi:hypothetical protein